MDKKSKIFLDYVVIVFLAVLLAADYVFFIVPNRFAPAGVGGIATMIEYKTGFSIGFITLIVNVPLSIFAFFYIDRDFALKTFFYAVAYSVAYFILGKVVPNSVKYDAEGIDTIFPCLIAGMISGLVYGLSFRRNSSTGGFDVVSKFISKKHPTLNFFWVSFFINAVIAIASLFVYGETANGFKLDYKPVCLCLLYIFLSNFIGNQILKGSNTAYKFTVITTKAEEIEKEVIKTLKHSATRIEGQGIYTDEEKKILICVVNKHQIVQFKKILYRHGETFTFVETVNETVGNFKKIR